MLYALANTTTTPGWTLRLWYFWGRSCAMCVCVCIWHVRAIFIIQCTGVLRELCVMLGVYYYYMSAQACAKEVEVKEGGGVCVFVRREGLVAGIAKIPTANTFFFGRIRANINLPESSTLCVCNTLHSGLSCRLCECVCVQ